MSDKNSTLPPVPAQPTAQPTSSAAIPPPDVINPNIDTGPGGKSVAIGVGALVVVAIIIFFIRQGFVNWLVGSLKRSPNSASLSGWGLFGALFFGATVATLAIISPSLLGIIYVGPLASLSAICLIVCVVSAMRR